MEGATTEHGPLALFDIKESCSSSNCDYTEQLSSNPYAWNKHANVLYLGTNGLFAILNSHINSG